MTVLIEITEASRQVTRGNARVNQTPGFALKAGVATVTYRYSFTRVSPELDITEVTVDYIIAYSCKGNATLKEEMAQTRNLVMHSSELTGCQMMSTVCAGKF
jgi:hypothetical protein